MAATLNKLESTLVLKYTGEPKDGKPRIVTQRVSGVKVDATEQKVYDTATTLGSLINFAITNIEKEDYNEIINQ